MFTGIVEAQGHIVGLEKEGTNVHYTLDAPFEEGVQIDQSIAHDGVCLTVTSILEKTDERVRYTVTAVEETLLKTNLITWQVGRKVNLERCVKAGARLDGHFVQGHVDTTGKVARIEERDGSWNFFFDIEREHAHLWVPKGSVCINGVSLTVVEAGAEGLSVTIIPYTFEHTGFAQLSVGDPVNLEFDILGKYMHRFWAMQQASSVSTS